MKAPWYSKNFGYLEKGTVRITQGSILDTCSSYRVDIQVRGSTGRAICRVEEGKVMGVKSGKTQRKMDRRRK
jgi:hypothetical protein